MTQALFYTFLAGVIGTGSGGLIGIVVGNNKKHYQSHLFSICAGIMIGIVCFDLLFEALTLISLKYVLLYAVFGIYIMNLMDSFIGKKKISNDNNKKQGLMILLALFLHNLPEGMAIASAINHDFKMGLILTLTIALHDIPEGMAISLAFVQSKMNKLKVLLLTIISGLPTIVGGVIGAYLGTSSFNVGLSLAFASGAMLYVVFYEMLPSVYDLKEHKRNFILIIMGLLLSLALITFQ